MPNSTLIPGVPSRRWPGLRNKGDGGEKPLESSHWLSFSTTARRTSPTHAKRVVPCTSRQARTSLWASFQSGLHFKVAEIDVRQGLCAGFRTAKARVFSASAGSATRSVVFAHRRAGSLLRVAGDAHTAVRLRGGPCGPDGHRGHRSGRKNGHGLAPGSSRVSGAGWLGSSRRQPACPQCKPGTWWRRP